VSARVEAPSSHCASSTMQRSVALCRFGKKPEDCESDEKRLGAFPWLRPKRRQVRRAGAQVGAG